MKLLATAFMYIQSPTRFIGRNRSTYTSELETKRLQYFETIFCGGNKKAPYNRSRGLLVARTGTEG
jgi:hypothetical protein